MACLVHTFKRHLHILSSQAHFDTLLKNNALDDVLARRIEAFRSVASASEGATEAC